MSIAQFTVAFALAWSGKEQSLFGYADRIRPQVCDQR